MKKRECFLEKVREEYRLTVPELYNGMGWGRQRYYLHVRTGATLSPTELPKLAIALNAPLSEVSGKYLSYYYKKALEKN